MKCPKCKRDMKETKEQLESRVNGWFGYAKFGNTFKLREKFLSMLPSIKNTETKDLYRLG